MLMSELIKYKNIDLTDSDDENKRVVLQDSHNEEYFGVVYVSYIIDENCYDAKPVIYLYPDEDNTEVRVNLDYDGEFIAVYPEFTNDTKLLVTADKDDSIILNNKKYNYLY